MPPRRPHWFPGGPPGDDPLAPRDKPGLFNPLSRVPSWMRGALGLLRDELPARLRTDQIIAAVEFGQQGWGFVEYFPLRIVKVPVGGVGFQFPPELEIDETRILRLIYIDAENSAAANRDLDIQLETPALGLVPPVVRPILTTTVVAPASVATHAEVAQGVPIVIPPGSRLGFRTGVIAAETMTLSMLWATIPAGYPLSGF